MPDCHKCPHNGRGDPACLSCPGPSEPSHAGRAWVSLDAAPSMDWKILRDGIPAPIPAEDCFPGDAGPAVRAAMYTLLDRLAGLSAAELDCLLHVLLRGGGAAALARRAGISRQSAWERLQGMRRKHPWLAGMIEGAGVGNKGGAGRNGPGGERDKRRGGGKCRA